VMFAQGRIARANQAAVGQQAIFTVVGNSTPECVDLAQFDLAGDLLSLSSYYVAPMATLQVSAPPIPGFKTTAVFAVSSPLSVTPSTACSSQPTSYLSDQTREPRVYEQLVGGNAPLINVGQLNAALGIAVAFCNQTQAVVGNSNVQTGSGTKTNSQTIGQVCANLAGNQIIQVNSSSVNQVVVFGFEEVSFTNSAGDPFLTAAGVCTPANPPLSNSGGASWILTCTPPSTGGSFSGQTF